MTAGRPVEPPGKQEACGEEVKKRRVDASAGAPSSALGPLCEDVIYTTMEVAERLKVTPKAVREWIGRGELQAVDLGQGYRVLQRDFDAFLARRRGSGSKGKGKKPT